MMLWYLWSSSWTLAQHPYNLSLLPFFSFSVVDFFSSNVLSLLFLDDLFFLYFFYLSCNVCVLFTTPYKEVFAKKQERQRSALCSLQLIAMLYASAVLTPTFCFIESQSVINFHSKHSTTYTLYLLHSTFSMTWTVPGLNQCLRCLLLAEVCSGKE